MKVPSIIGMPGGMPSRGLGGDGMSDAYPTDTYRAAALSLPILEVIPCVADYNSGTELYELIGSDEYATFLRANDIELTENKLYIACHALSNPSETYSNSFSPNSIAESVSSLGTENVQDLMFMSGQSDVTQVFKKMEESDNDLVQGIGTVSKAVSKTAGNLLDAAGKIGGSKGQAISSMIKKVASHPGSKIDFPLMWRSSSYSASYNITTRLYNPLPGNDEMYENLIVASLGALIALATPVSDDGDLYHWPYICRCYVPGLFRLRAAYVSNITVSKGGDAMDISLRNNGWMRPNLVDVQLTFSSLYNVMPMTKQKQIKDRPTLWSEIDALKQQGADSIPTSSGGAGSNNPDPSSNRDPSLVDRANKIWGSVGY